MARLMTDKSFRMQQWDRRYDRHVAAILLYINEYVDYLRQPSQRGFVPYIAPLNGGINASLLSILRDPGPMTQDDVGSGFICMENNDQTAEALYNYYKNAAISASDIVPWNAYPWYINKKPSSSQLKAGAETIASLLTLLPKLKVIMLHGNDAHKAWDYLPEKAKSTLVSRNIEVIKTFHPSKRALICNPTERSRRISHIAESFQRAASIIYNT